MEKNAKKRPPPIGAIYAYKRSSTIPFCRITGKSHSMDEHHYVPSPDDFPKFERHSGCRITEKHQYFKDYKYAYPIIDLDGTTRMVTEHDFHCRITAKYRAMAGHKYLYPVLGASTDKTVDDMMSVVEEDNMRDVLIPTEVELIVKGGVDDVLRLKDSEYLFIHSKEGSIIPAALKEIRGKGSDCGSKQRRHTLPVTLEVGMASDLEEFRRSVRIKMLSEVKIPPEEIFGDPLGTEVFDIIREDVEVLQDVRKTRPKRPGKQKTGGSFNKKRIIDDSKPFSSDVKADKECKAQTNQKVEAPPTKVSRLEKYKLQFSAFESTEAKESGNRLTLVGAFDENDIEELDFGEPMEIQCSTVSSTHKFSAIVIDDVQVPLSSCISNTEIESNGNIFHDSASKKDVDNNYVHNGISTVTDDFGHDTLSSMSEHKEQTFSSSISSWKSIETLDQVIDGEGDIDKRDCFSNGRKDYMIESLQGIREIDEIDEPEFRTKPNINKSSENECVQNGIIEISENSKSSNSSKCILPKKINLPPHSVASKNLMNELKEKLSAGKKKRKTEEKMNGDIISENGKINEHKNDTEMVLNMDNNISHGLNNMSQNSNKEIAGKISPSSEVTEKSVNKNAKEIPEKIKPSQDVNCNQLCIFEIKNTTKDCMEVSALMNDNVSSHRNPENDITNVQIKLSQEISNDTLSDKAVSSIKINEETNKITKMNETLNDKSITSLKCSKISEKDQSLLLESTNNVNTFEFDEISAANKSIEQDRNNSMVLFENNNNDVSNKNDKNENLDTNKSLTTASQLYKSESTTKCDLPFLDNQNIENDITKNKSSITSEPQTFDTVSKPHQLENFINGIHEFEIQKDNLTNKNDSMISNKRSLVNGYETLKYSNDSNTLPGQNSSDKKLKSVSLNETYILHQQATTTSKPSEQIGSKPGLEHCTEFPMSVDSLFPFSKNVNSTEMKVETTLVSETFQIRNSVTSELPSQDHTIMSSKCEGNVLSLTNGGMSLLENNQFLSSDVKNNEDQNEGIDVYVAIMDFKPMASDEEAVSMREGQRVEIIDASKPRRWLVRVLPMDSDESPKEGYVPACYLEKSTAYETLSNYVVTEAELDPKELEAVQNREAIVKELVETEEDFAKDMLYVVDNYYKQMDNPRLPKEFRDRKGSVFSNFKDISDFHNNVLMKGVNYHAKEPTKLGKTFLRLERDFDMHASYCWNEARAQKLLKEGTLKEFFDDHSKMIDDDKLLADHLKLPIQRLNDYQLLLKELIKYSSRLNEDTTDLQKALDFIHSINNRTKDLLYIQAIEGCQGDLLKIGRIIRHMAPREMSQLNSVLHLCRLPLIVENVIKQMDFSKKPAPDIFDVNEGNEVSSSERYVFLFKGRVFITEKKITSEKESYHVTNLFKLQDVEFIENIEGDPLKLLFKSHKKNRLGFPLSLRARSAEQKSTWVKEFLSANQVVEDLGDLEPSLEHPLVAAEQPTSKSEEIVEEPGTEKPQTVSLKRQASVKKATKTPDSSVPQTPTETDNTAPHFTRQDSEKKAKKSSEPTTPATPTDSADKPPKLVRQDSKIKSSDTSAPDTPTESSEKRPRLSRQDSKKSKSSDTSAPETPVETSDKPPQFTRQDSKKSKASDISEPQTPAEATAEPSLSRQDSVKSKVSNKSEPQTPTEAVPASPFTRQDSVKSKASNKSEPQTPTEAVPASPLTRQDSVKSKTSNKSEPQTPTEAVPVSPLTRQDSVKSKASNKSEPQTPTEAVPASPLTRQDSVKSKTSNKSQPQTPTEAVPASPLTRQDSVKSKASNKSEPQTPTEAVPASPLTRQDSVKSKASNKSEPQTPTEDISESPLTRQDSVKSKASNKSEPQTPTEAVPASPLTRQDSVKKKQKKASVSEKEPDSPAPIPEQTQPPSLTRQESVKKEKKSVAADKKKSETEDETTKTKLSRQDSLKKKEQEVSEDKTSPQETKPKTSGKKPKQGEESSGLPKIIMSEDPSGSDARMESVEFGDDNLTIASESLRSDDSMTPTGSEYDSMDKPRFSKTLRGVTCSLGETAVLECETEGSPEPTVTWLRDNQKIAKSKRIATSSIGQKHSLKLKDVVADDGGLYTVVATNSKGSASCSAPLNLKLALLGLPKEDSRPTTPGGTVLPHAPVFKVKLNKETQLLEGTSVRFELVVRGSPEPVVKFLKDGKELKLDDRVRVSYESKEVFELILDHVVAKDAGTYTIIGTNAEGEDKTVGNLSVVKHKDIFKGLEEPTMEEEREPTPRPKTPKFKWFKDGQFFEANERFQVIFNEEQDSLALMFQHVTPEDAGLYTCVASTSTGSKIACSAELTVQGVIRQVEAPSIKAELSDTEATEGGSAMLELKITGYPKPKVTWYHKNKEVSTGGRFRFLFADEETFTLVIKNVKKEDGGKFSVKATNEMGEAESSCNLTVKSAPSFVKGLKDMGIMAEDMLKLEVQIDGNPVPEVKWYKDGQPLSPNDRIKIVESAGKQALLISGAKPTDSGSYSCVITNDLGNQAEFSNVVVKASPTFVKGMENVQGLEGENLKFNVEINGNPKPTLKWSKDGKDLSVDGKRIKMTEDSSNVYTLTIEKSTAADVGVYTCELRNEHGMKASSGNLNIKLKPEFIKKLSDIETNEGDSGLILNTTTKGYPAPTIKWFCGDSDLKDNKSFIITSENEGTSHSLKLKKVTRKEAGKYTCEATNEMGKATTSGQLSVKVTVKKPEISQQLNPTQLVEGKPGKLVAKVTGEPKPKITWMKDGKPISLNGRFSMEEADDGTVTLHISNVTPDDAGVYSLVAVSDEGEATSEAPVTTIPPGKKPEFLKELEKVDLLEGQPLNLEAKVTGKPTSIKWQKGNEDLADGGRIKITEAPDGTIALLIDKVNQTDAGKYAVIATNSEGKARTAALVQVQAMKKPEIVGTMEPLTIKDGDTGELKIKATGEPKPSVTWLKDGKVLRPTNRVESIEEPDGTIALVIKNARPEDAGNYSVVVENSMGEAKSSAPVAVEQAPTFQKPLEPVNVVEGYPAKLEAKLAGSPPPEIKWFKDGDEIVPDNTHVKEIRDPDGTVALLIDNCKPEDGGKYSLTAKNPLGESSSSGKLGVTGKESSDPPSVPCFVSPIGNLTVKEGEPIRFEAVISGNPLPDINWVVNDRPLTPSDNTLITFDGEKAILEIRSSTPDHIGVYQCKLTNPLGEASNEGSVSVQEKTAPRFIQRLNDYNGFVDQPLKLSCKVTGYPEPEINWYFNGDLISPKNLKYSFTNFGDVHALNIHTCKPEDSGVYECVAKNPVGEDHTRSGVNISDKVEKGEQPMFLKRIGDNEVMEGMTAKFTACVTGIPTPDVSWFKDGQPLESSPRHKMELESTGILRLIVREVESGDYGDYSVTLSNVHGSATSSAKLIPDSLDEKYMTPIGDQFVDFGKFKKTGIPVPLSEKPKIIRMDDTSLTLGWKPSVPNTPRVPVTYQLEMAKHPDGEWTPYKTGLKDTLCDVRDLRPGQDYKFQVRVENKHGVSDPSPYVTAHRSKIYQPPNPADFKPKDYSLEHPPLTKYAAPPKFVRKEEDVMYGVRGLPVTIEFWVYGQPQPQVTWFKGESQIGKDKYGFLQDRNGKLNVFIDCMTDDFVGTYTCVAVNDEGEATMKIKLLIAEPPIFLERLDETTAMSRRSARMQCRVSGLPYPKIKWFRDWHPLYESERVKILWEEPDICTLFISNLITRDNALYSCQATNIAGTATNSASLNVEDSEDAFDYKTYCRPIPVRPRTKIFEDFYDIGDELGRGTQGITYHGVKRDTGDSYAAKTMHGKGKLKEYMKIEMDNMNQLCHPKLVRLRDAFETKDTLTLVTDICGGGELLSSIIKRGGLTERDVANYVKQVLEGLDYMHSRYLGHLGLTIGDILVARMNSDDVRFGDFSLAARLLPGKDYFSEYGHPEFVAPEIAKKEPATVLSDMWSVGVISYLLLSGISPFLGENDRETLTRVQQGKINFVEEAFTGVSDDAKDFMSKLLVFDPKNRMDVKSALQHRWFKYYKDKPRGEEKVLSNLDRLKEYQRKWKEWYANASCKRYFRRRTLESCFHHPSRMIYPPGEPYTPSSSPEPVELDRTHVKPSHFDDVTFKQRINREDIDFRSESSYQNGPDTYLLQLRDTDFPLRLREYLRVGASTSPSIAASLRDKHWGDSTLVIRERRKFVDVMDEEIDDEKKGVTKTTVPRRLYHEIGTLGFAHEQMEQLKKDVWKEKSREVEIGMAPYFREKIRNSAMKENDEVVFTCYAVGDPKVDYTWFRNDGILLESSRIVVTRLKDGRSEMRINPTRAYDIGVYKCVARNMHGVSCCRARLKLGSKPGRPEAPVVKGTSDTEIYITWAVPRDEGNCTTLGYTLEYKRSDEENWQMVLNNIEHEYFVIRNLLPSTFYQFRVKAFNKFGWGQPGFPTEPVSTKEEGASKVRVSPRRKYQQEFTERTPDYELTEAEIQSLDYSVEKDPIPLTEGEPLDLYRIVSEMDRGRFSVVLNVWVKESNTSSIAKVIQTTNDADGRQEYEVMKSLCHERVVTLLSASYHADKTVLVMEKLSGVDIMSYLALRQEYNEELVITMIKQVLEALQYLHFRGICYLELQPDNVVTVNLRDSDIKLIDFGSARYVPKTGAKINVKGTTEYLAPEILKDEQVSTLTDVWCVGVLTYILLSGVPPFRGKDEEDTKDNVTFVRYHFDNLHSDVTAEATRFLLNIFKQCPIKRLTIDECLEHKWLAPSEYMIMKRESARFLPDKLANFARNFHASKYEAMNPEMLTSLGMSSSKSELKVDEFL